jgi:sensor histidine kinase regulating citrate/malate metabolism
LWKPALTKEDPAEGIAQARTAKLKVRNYNAFILFVICRFLNIWLTADYENKTFQSLLVTIPTGQGTGLGLSLAYDIVKAHGGELKVETTEGDGSKFIIQLSNL